jgi:hypothetical protein
MTILPRRRARRQAVRAGVGAALALALVPTLLGGAPALAQASTTTGWSVYFYEPQPAPVAWRCALSSDTATVVRYKTNNVWFVVANSQTRSVKGGMCQGGDYFPGTNAIRSQSALIYWVNGQATLCSMSANAYNGGTAQSLSAAAAQCGYGTYSSTSFHDTTFGGVHRTSMMTTSNLVAP